MLAKKSVSFSRALFCGVLAVASACAPHDNAGSSNGAGVQGNNAAIGSQSQQTPAGPVRINQGTWVKRDPGQQSGQRNSYGPTPVMCYLPQGSEFEATEQLYAKSNHSQFKGARAFKIAQYQEQASPMQQQAPVAQANEVCSEEFLTASGDNVFLYRPHFSGGPAVISTFAGKFVRPVPKEAVLTSAYGWRWGRMHNGIDLAAGLGTPILTPADGVVRARGDGQTGQMWDIGTPEQGAYNFGFGGYGNFAFLDHGQVNGSGAFYQTLYGHLNRISVAQGAKVSVDDLIGEMGTTGNSTGVHLHWEIWRSGEKVNPQNYIVARDSLR